MKFPFICTLLLIFLSYNFIEAQNFQDCTNAFKVCAAQGTTHFEPAEGANNFDSGLSNTCLPAEVGSTWIYWTVLQGGWMTFTLFPDSSYQNLDFILFKTDSPADCADKEKIRCMASGENVGADPATWIACSGQTGLSAGQSDTNESAGCSPGDNNLLAAHFAETGDHYLMMINNSNFSNGGPAAGFTLQFGGSVNLDCADVISSNNELTDKTQSISLYPNPSSGILFFDIDEELLGSDLVVYNLLNQVVFTKKNLVQQKQAMDFQHLPNGNYTVALQKDTKVATARFVLF